MAPPPGPDRDVAAGFAERNLQVLQAWDAMDEHGPVEKPDENAPYAADIMRLELKINLLLDLVGQILAANRPRPSPPPCASMPWVPCGAARLPCPKPVSRACSKSICTTASRSRCGFPGRVTNVTPDGHVKVRFAPWAKRSPTSSRSWPSAATAVRLPAPAPAARSMTESP